MAVRDIERPPAVVPDRPSRRVVAPPGRYRGILALQSGAGNRAVAGLLAPTVQRCGPTPCDCSDDERAEYAATHPTAQRAVETVQRDPDFAIDGKFQDAAAHTNTLYFTRASAAPDATELAKVPALATPTTKPLTLVGSASEEGPAVTNASLVAGRLSAVGAALDAAGHDKTVRTVEAKPSAGAGNIDYRQARSVEVHETGTASGILDCSVGDGENDCGPEPNPFSTALDQAHAIIAAAVGKLSAPDAATDDLLTKLFGDPSAAPDLIVDYKMIDAHLNDMKPFGGGAGHRCVNNCNADCGGGADAFNAGEGGGALMTLCPEYVATADLDERAAVLIHEGSHGTPGLDTEDLSYRWQRLITLLPPGSAKKNADSFTALAQLLAKPGSITLGPDHPDTHDAAMTPDQQHAGDVAVAWLQQWLMGVNNDVSALYGIINESRAATPPAWTNSVYEDSMREIAPLFGLHVPPKVPTIDDQTAIAGIFDRYQRMQGRVDAQLAISATPGPVTAFVGTDLHLGTEFFAQDPRHRTETLLRAIIAAEPSIRAGLRDAYFRVVLRLVTLRGLGTP